MEKPYVIGITGGSGSGKTSFVRDLKAAFPREVSYLSQDDYYVPREQQIEDDKGVKNFDLPTSIHLDEYVRDINLLIAGETVRRKEYVFNNELATPRDLVFNPAKVIVLEGLFILHVSDIVDLLDLSVFVHARDDQKVSRRIKRDRIERNYPLEDVLYRYEHHVMPSFLKYIYPYRDHADLVINNNVSYAQAMDVISTFIESKI